MIVLSLNNSMAMAKTIRPNRNWSADEEKETKQRNEETLHKVLFRCGISLTDDQTRFKLFENSSILLTRFSAISVKKSLRVPSGAGNVW